MKDTLVVLGAGLSLASASAIDLRARATSNLTCLAKGYDAGHASFIELTPDNGVVTYADCSDVCNVYQNGHKGYPSCLSFNWVASTSCDLYDVPVKGNFVADGSSNHVFSDKDCTAQAKTCGVAGYSINDGTQYYKSPSASACSTDCAGDTEFCVSWTYDSASGYCNWFSEVVALNVSPDSSSPYAFYDNGCPFSAPSSTTTAKKTTTKSTSPTTTVKTTTGKSAASTTTSTKSSLMMTTTTVKSVTTTALPTTKFTSTITTKPASTTKPTLTTTVKVCT